MNSFNLFLPSMVGKHPIYCSYRHKMVEAHVDMMNSYSLEASLLKRTYDLCLEGWWMN